MSDSRDLARHEPGRGVVMSEAEQRFAQTIAMVREAMTNPAVDADKAKVMAELLNNQEDRALLSEFNRDLNAAIMDMPVITKGGIITIPARDGKPARTQGRFARFEDIDRVVRPILQRHNLAIRFEVGDQNNMVTVCPIISHANGHTERGGAMRLPLDDSGAKNKVQGTGSAVSYGKRYTMCALLNIITEGSDDDGSLGKFNIDMPHERQVTVLEEAEAAHAEGRYTEWWAALGVKDRAWMVKERHHARLGGGAELPDLTRESRDNPPADRQQPPADQAREESRSAPPPPAQQQGKHDVSTPQGWTNQYVDDMRAAPDLDAVARIKQKGAGGLAKLARDNTKLYDLCDAAEMDARDRLAPAASDTLFGQEDQ
jgi:hypothetical protein